MKIANTFAFRGQQKIFFKIFCKIEGLVGMIVETITEVNSRRDGCRHGQC